MQLPQARLQADLIRAAVLEARASGLSKAYTDLYTLIYQDCFSSPAHYKQYYSLFKTLLR
jgi:hypothetical protein